MNLTDARGKLDDIDNEIKRLFKERMKIIEQVTEIKKRNGISVLDKNRENDIISRITQGEDKETSEQLHQLYTAILEISRSYQNKKLSNRYGLIGHPLSHSYSSQIHNMIGRYDYDIFDLTEDTFDEFMKRREFKGINVTIPYKKKVTQYCSELSETAERIGSVNTIIKRDDDSLYGHNTDYMGFIYMCDTADISLMSKKVTVLGSGGTSLTAQAVAHDKGAERVTVVSRTGYHNYGNLHLLRDTEVIINTTPIGMYPHCGESVIDLSDFPNCVAVIDVIYNPLKTKLLLDAENLGLKTVNGLSMLVAQAVYSAELFTDDPINSTLITTILQNLTRDMTNIILIGMPGCGKTTIGKALAQTLGREFVDIDEAITPPPSVIIESQGEESFRDLESQIAEKLGKRNGLVIATGGGTILRENNRDALRQNGFVIWLRRPLELLDTLDRPLSKDITALTEMYRIREPLYRECCDIIIDNINTVSDTVKEITDKRI